MKVGPKEVSRVSKLALKIGSRVDDLAKNDIQRSELKLAAKDGLEVRNCIEGWNRFKLEHPEVKFISCDKLVKDDKLLIAGTMDIETSDSILDIKCSGRISDNYWLQVAMYNYMSGLNKEKIAILRLHKSLGIYEYHTIPYDKDLVSIFVGLLKAYRFYNRTGVGGDSDERDDAVADDEIGEEPEVAGSKVSPNW